MPRKQSQRTNRKIDEVESLYPLEEIRAIARQGGFRDTDIEKLRSQIIAAVKMYLELIEEEASKQKARNRQAKIRERRAKKGFTFEIFEADMLKPRKPGRPKETSMMAFVSVLAAIYAEHSGREPKSQSDRRPDDRFDIFLVFVCNQLFEQESLERYVRWFERERKEMKFRL